MSVRSQGWSEPKFTYSCMCLKSWQLTSLLVYCVILSHSWLRVDPSSPLLPIPEQILCYTDSYIITLREFRGYYYNLIIFHGKGDRNVDCRPVHTIICRLSGGSTYFHLCMSAPVSNRKMNWHTKSATDTKSCSIDCSDWSVAKTRFGQFVFFSILVKSPLQTFAVFFRKNPQRTVHSSISLPRIYGGSDSPRRTFCVW